MLRTSARPLLGSGGAMALLWLAVLVMSVCLLCSEKDPDSPIKNLRMEPGSRRLTWDLSGNVSEIKCFINSKYITKAIDSRYCQFYVLPLCEVKNFTISVKQDPPFSTGLQYVPRGAEGKPAAAARGLDCWVHDVDFLTCSWEVGRAAPGDVQYRLYWRDLKAYREQECPRYEANNRGVHVRCRFDDVSRLQRHIQFWVNGTSRRSGIPCSDLCVELPEIERLSPPHITATCNKSYSMMEWKVLSHFNHRFLYELQIQKGTDPASTEKLYENHFVIYNPGNYVAKLKVQGFFRKDWSEWSAPQLFVCDPKDEHRRDWLVSVLVLLGTLLVLGLVALLCRSFAETLPSHPSHEGPHHGQPPEPQAGALGHQQSQPGGLSGGRGAHFGGNMKRDLRRPSPIGQEPGGGSPEERSGLGREHLCQAHRVNKGLLHPVPELRGGGSR
ncbi:interleukin-3 receptor subunit alpha isoform X1 [Canis lupus dingo]|uniref:interleukin-3 receptor subunit alpha isoform X1 n=2 Tax=Canis lupus dingo TaxID=286419 RepID=UPI0020C54AFC|nr:interleukin-3 receptor subunit alpha isoform X1 [Canis lupus dingo]